MDVVLAHPSITPSDSTYRMCSSLPTILGSLIRGLWFSEDFISTRGHGKDCTEPETISNLITLGALPVSGPADHERCYYVAGAMDSDYHENQDCCYVMRAWRCWDINLRLLVLSCPVITASKQVQQPIPDESKTTKGQNLCGLPCQESK